MTYVILSQKIFLWADTEIYEKQPKNVKSILSRRFFQIEDTFFGK